MNKQEVIDNFISKLEEDHCQGEGFGVICFKCGSLNVEFSYDGDGGPVTSGAYTAGFDGQHFIKCMDCGNAVTKKFYVDMNGAWED